MGIVASSILWLRPAIAIPAVIGSWRHRLIRAAERALPLSILGAVFSPVFLASAVVDLDRIGKRVAWLRRLGPVAGRRRWIGWGEVIADRYRLAAASLVLRWPDRLVEQKWQDRCRVTNESALWDALATGRPVMLLTLHYGAIWPLGHWVRSRGHRAATIAMPRGDDRLRTELDLAADRANGQVGLPRLFGCDADGLRDARDFLVRQPGHVLAVVFDGGGGDADAVPVDVGGVRFAVRLGAFRLARSTNAIVLPFLMRADAGMGCEITFGQSVPDDLLADRKRHAEAAAQALSQLLPLALRSPAQFDPGHAPKPLTLFARKP